MKSHERHSYKFAPPVKGEKMSEDTYVEEKLIWVKQRLAILEKVDEKLKEMKEIAEYARDNKLSEGEKIDLNIKINKLDYEVKILYEKDKNFWLEWQ